MKELWAERAHDRRESCWRVSLREDEETTVASLLWAFTYDVRDDELEKLMDILHSELDAVVFVDEEGVKTRKTYSDYEGAWVEEDIDIPMEDSDADKTEWEPDIVCDRCGRGMNGARQVKGMEGYGGCCAMCGDNLCAECAGGWDYGDICEKCAKEMSEKAEETNAQ